MESEVNPDKDSLAGRERGTMAGSGVNWKVM